MNLLLDTYALIWYITDNHRLPAKTRSLIELPQNNCFVSLATYWEMAIKNSLGRLDFKKPIMTIFDIIEQSGFAAAVYTQLTDVETEINGLITYVSITAVTGPRFTVMPGQ